MEPDLAEMGSPPPPSSLKALLSFGGVNFKACLRWSDVKFSNLEQINGL